MLKRFPFFLIIVIVFSFHLSSAWWNQEYTFRRKIFISETSRVPNEFTINFTINTKDLINKGKMNYDCSDLNVIENNRAIDKIVENCNSEKTTVLFKISNHTINEYFVYYGNKNTSQRETNKYNVYYLYDDFESYPIGVNPPFNGWNSNGGTWKISSYKSFSGNKSVEESGAISQWKLLMNNKTIPENYTYILHNMINVQVNVWSMGVEFNNQNYTSGYRLTWFYQIGRGGWFLELRRVVNNIEFSLINTSANSLIQQPNQWYEFKIIRSYPNIKVYINNSLIFDVNDTTFKSGSIGFSRYSNIEDSSRKSWYDDVIVMLYMEPWPEVYLGEEEQYMPTSLIIQAPNEIKAGENQKIFFSLFQNFTPITNLTLNDINISIQDASVQKIGLKSYNNGSYSLEIKASTSFLGKKKIIIETPIASNFTHSFITVEPKENSIIITNNDWRNYIPAVSTGKKVLITNSSRIATLYKPEQVFLLGINIPLEKEHYYIDRDALYLMFFKNKDIVIANNKDAAIASSMLKMPIIAGEAESIELLNAKNIHNFSTVTQVQNYYFTHPFRTNYLILANKDSDKSMFAAPLAFKHDGFIIFSSGNADEAKQSLKQAITRLKYRLKESYKFNNKLFLALIDVPYFSIRDPVDDGLMDQDSDYIKTDNFYADINDDGYLDLSVSRLDGYDEAITHQISAEAPGKKALIISVYDTPRALDLFYGIPLMRYSQAIDARLSYKGFDTTRLVEQRSSRTEYSSENIKSLTNAIRDLIENEDFTDVIEQIKILFSTFNEAAYLLVEFDWDNILTKLLSGEDFVLQHLPLYDEDSLIGNAADKDVIVYNSFGNSTHWFTPNNSIAISSLPEMPSFIYLYYSKSDQSLRKLQEKGAISIMATTSSVYTPQSSYTSYLFFKSFNGEIAYVAKNAKNSILSYYKAIRNFSFYNPEPYLKEYYSRILYGDPAKVFDPYQEFMQSEDVSFDNSLRLQAEIEPKYKIISNGTHKFAFFYDADFMDDIPLYKKTFLLPEDAEVIAVNFYPEFKDEGVYSQVNASFWYNSYKLLDNRTAVDIIAIPITTSGQVLSKLKIELAYNAGLEITKIKAENAVLAFSVYSNAERDANAIVLLEKDGESFYINKSIHLNPGMNSFSLLLPTKGYGKYSVALIIEADKLAGPRYTFFELKPPLARVLFPLSKIKLDFSSLLVFKKSFSESISVRHEANKKVIDYKTADTSLHVELSDELNAILSTKGKRLEVQETAEEKSYTLKSPDGYAVIYSSKGMIKQTYSKPEMLDELRKMILAYNEMMLKIQDKIV